MRGITTRLRRLEARLPPQEDGESQHVIQFVTGEGEVTGSLVLGPNGRRTGTDLEGPDGPRTWAESP